MKPTLTHMSRSDMKRMLRNNEVPENTLIISINDTDQEVREMTSLYWGTKISKLAMNTYIFKDDETSFTQGQAKCIYEDIDPLRYSHFIIHCFAGISRSAAVAKWINDYLELDIEKYNKYTQHNKHVYDTLCAVSGVENINNYYRDMENEDD